MHLVVRGPDQISNKPGNYWLIIIETMKAEEFHCNFSTIYYTQIENNMFT